MLAIARPGFTALTLVALVASSSPAQAPPASKGQAPAPAGKAAASDPVLATVNGEAIRRSEVVGLLSRFSIPAGEEQVAYEKAMDLIVGTRLLAQFLAAQKIKPDAAEIAKVIDQYEKNFKENNSSLTNELAASGTTPEEFRARIAQSVQWKQYVLTRATDAELQKYAKQNADVFNRAQVQASHILISVPAEASEADKEKARQQIAAIKKEIDSGKIAFADAANKYSQDPGNKDNKSGGDLGYFPRKGKYIEAFSAAAFGLKKDAVSDPVFTEYGWHLIKVTDRKEGEPVDFKQIRDLILNQYAADLQNQIVTDQKKVAKVDIKPMPPGLVPTEAPEPAPDATKGAAPKAGAAAPKTAAPKAAAPK